MHASVVLDGDPASPKRDTAAPPTFQPMSLAKWLDEIKMPLGTEWASAQATLC